MKRVLLLLCLLVLSPVGAISPATAGERRPMAGESVLASWYGFESGSRTANGERFNPHGVTCAHRTLPFGTRLQVTYGGRSVVCRVNDRGPFIRGRSLDLSLGAARAIGLTHAGVGRVTIERID